MCGEAKQTTVAKYPGGGPRTRRSNTVTGGMASGKPNDARVPEVGHAAFKSAQTRPSLSLYYTLTTPHDQPLFQLLPLITPPTQVLAKHGHPWSVCGSGTTRVRFCEFSD